MTKTPQPSTSTQAETKRKSTRTPMPTPQGKSFNKTLQKDNKKKKENADKRKVNCTVKKSKKVQVRKGDSGKQKAINSFQEETSELEKVAQLVSLKKIKRRTQKELNDDKTFINDISEIAVNLEFYPENKILYEKQDDSTYCSLYQKGTSNEWNIEGRHSIKAPTISGSIIAITNLHLLPIFSDIDVSIFNCNPYSEFYSQVNECHSFYFKEQKWNKAKIQSFIMLILKRRRSQILAKDRQRKCASRKKDVQENEDSSDSEHVEKNSSEESENEISEID
jgi:hypothetical protein